MEKAKKRKEGKKLQCIKKNTVSSNPIKNSVLFIEF